MQALCCCPSRGAHPDRNISTPTAQLPARPAQAKLAKIRVRGQNHDGPAVLIDTLAPSLVATPRQQAVLDPTVIEVDNSDSEDERLDQRTPTNTSLGAFKTRLIRRLSHKSQSRRQSQQSVGSSEEELARRAELRRLRHKRIQEELSTDAEEVDAGIKSNEHVPSRRTSQSPSERPDISGVGPRDNIEFSVCDIDTVTSSSSESPAREMIAVALPIVVTGTSTSLRRRSSCPTSPPSACEHSALQATNALREHGSMPKMPLSSHAELGDASVASSSSSIASWRLSYSAAHLAEYIGGLPGDTPESDNAVVHRAPHMGTSDVADPRPEKRTVDESNLPLRASTVPKVEQEAEDSFASISNADKSNFEQSTAIFHNTTHSEQYSPLDLWLRVSDTLQSISHSSTRRNSDSVLEGRPDPALFGEMNPNPKTMRVRTLSSSSGAGIGPDLVKFQGSFPATERPSRPPASSCEKAEEPYDPGTVCEHVNRVPRTENPSSSHSASELVDVQCVRATPGKDTDNEPKGSPKTQNCGHNKLVISGDVDAVKSPEAHCDPTDSAHASTRPATASGNDNTLVASLDSNLFSKDGIIDQATNTAENAEPHGLCHVSSPVDTRLPPHADDDLEQPARRPSLFARFFSGKGKSQNTLRKQQSHGDQPKDVGGAAIASHTTADAAHNTKQLRRGRGGSNEERDLKLEETATDLWQRALRLEAEQREACKGRQTESQHETPSTQLKSQLSRRASNEDAAPTMPHTREASSVYSRSHQDGSGFQSPSLRPVTGHDNMPITNITLESSIRIVKEWQHQIQSEQVEQSDADRSPSFRTHIYATHTRHGIPESWAKWPSHNREERNGATGVDDSVTPKDFAVAEAGVGSIKWSTDKDGEVPALEDSHTTPGRRSFSSKVGHSLRESLAKFFREHDGSNGSLNNHSTHTKRRPASSGELEYPELELIPQHGGYKELEALKRTIDHLKRPSVTSEARPRGLSGASSKAPLSLRFAQGIRGLQNGDISGSPDSCDFPNAVALQPPNTPVGRREVSQARSGTSQKYGTPLTHVSSYEDCVPTHMLDENDSAKSDTDLALRRSKSALEQSAPGLHPYNAWNGRSKSLSIKRSRGSGSASKELLNAEGDESQNVRDV